MSDSISALLPRLTASLMGAPYMTTGPGFGFLMATDSLSIALAKSPCALSVVFASLRRACISFFFPRLMVSLMVAPYKGRIGAMVVSPFALARVSDILTQLSLASLTSFATDRKLPNYGRLPGIDAVCGGGAAVDRGR